MLKMTVVLQTCLTIFTQHLATYVQSIVIYISYTSRCKHGDLQSINARFLCLDYQPLFDLSSYITYKSVGLIYKQDR
jgi:hypothetical protein